MFLPKVKVRQGGKYLFLGPLKLAFLFSERKRRLAVPSVLLLPLGSFFPLGTRLEQFFYAPLFALPFPLMRDRSNDSYLSFFSVLLKMSCDRPDQRPLKSQREGKRGHFHKLERWDVMNACAQFAKTTEVIAIFFSATPTAPMSS